MNIRFLRNHFFWTKNSDSGTPELRMERWKNHFLPKMIISSRIFSNKIPLKHWKIGQNSPNFIATHIPNQSESIRVLYQKFVFKLESKKKLKKY